MDNLGVQAFNEPVQLNFNAGTGNITDQGIKDILSTGSNPNSPPGGFDSDYYLRENLDVAVAVSSGVYENGWEHWLLHGREEGRLPAANIGQDIINEISENTPTVAKSENNDALTNVGIEKQQDWGKAGLSFIENAGQVDAEVKYQIKGGGHTFYFTPNEIIFTAQSQGEGETENTSSVVRSNLIGGNINPTIETLGKLPGVANFLNGDDPNQWQTDVSTYEGVVYRNVYEGIDRLYKGTEGHLKGEFIVAAGADAGQIKIQYKGIEDLQLREDGALIIKTETGELIDSAPYVYQEINGEIIEVESAYKLLGDGTVGFSLGAYDSAHTLVIDPVLVYSTYLGGNSIESTRSNNIFSQLYDLDITLDSANNIYVTGSTLSDNFPTTPNSLQGSRRGGTDAFITKINAESNQIVYSTFLGGSETDSARGIAVDNAGNAYITGYTASTDFPTLNPIKAQKAEGSDAFVTKINATGDRIVYSTYLGGDQASAIATDSAGNAYVTGTAVANDLLLVNPIQAQIVGDSDAFVSKINAAGSAIVYSTYLGGSDSDESNGLALDSADNAYIVGTTKSTNFPTVNAFQAQKKGVSDIFASKINAAGTSLIYSTYLGGEDSYVQQVAPSGPGVLLPEDIGHDIAVDSAGNAYIVGASEASDFPTVNALRATRINRENQYEAILTKLNPTGNQLVYSTYLGGLAASGVAVDREGSAYVTGTSYSFPAANSLYLTRPADGNAFVARVNANGSRFAYATELGGSGRDNGGAIGIDSVGNAYVAGVTTSTDFPTVRPIQAATSDPSGGGGGDIFISKLDPFGRFGRSTTIFSFAELLELEGQGKEAATLYFDEKYYLANNPDVAADVAKGNYAGGALEHFQKYGQLENRQPSLLFDPILYLEQNPDVKDAVQKGVYRSAWDHFARYGQYEERDLRLQIYDEGFYLANNPDVKQDVEAGVYGYGFEHFIRFGQFEKRDPSILFNTGYYLANNRDVAEDVSRGGSAFNHFVRYGISENRPNLFYDNRNPSIWFNAKDYLSQDEGLAAATAKGEVTSGIFHYLKFGQFEGRSPRLKLFDEKFYLDSNADVAADLAKGLYRSGYEHFIRYGQAEKRRPSEQYDEAFYLANNKDVAADVAKGLYRSGFEHFVNYGVAEGRAGFG